MSVRVVARIRPLHSSELDRDVIVAAEPSGVVKIPNPRNEAESFGFQFNNVYDGTATQQHIFDQEVAPTVKSLFKGLDVVIFAYGVTGTGKTHTMRGGKTLAERGLIPRLLSAIYRRARKIEKDSAAATSVQIAMSYYEIYCDRVYDLFEPPEKRTPAGLPIRDNGGKTVVVGLTERPCTTLKEFEQLYDHANINRSTSATKLNAHSSRSHAVLSVKITQITSNEVRVSTVSAIDLAGSEDNRRTDNGKERMVESAAINKSLFVLAQCVEAIARKQTRIPYRESRMTRILSIGQNQGITLMILQLSPVRNYHLDTLSSLNFANRTKKIEVNEVENQPFYRAVDSQKSQHVYSGHASNIASTTLQRQALRPKNLGGICSVPFREASVADMASIPNKAVRSFAVFADKTRPTLRQQQAGLPKTAYPSREVSKCRSNDSVAIPACRPAKSVKSESCVTSSVGRKRTITMTHESIEALIDRKVAEKLAESVTASRHGPDTDTGSNQDLSADVKARLDALERRVGAHNPEQSESVQFLLMAKQHEMRREDNSALKMYQLALPLFPENQKLIARMARLEERIKHRIEAAAATDECDQRRLVATSGTGKRIQTSEDQARPMENGTSLQTASREPGDDLAAALVSSGDVEQTPRTKNVLRIINSRDVAQIRLLKGVGAKKAEAIVNALCAMDDDAGDPEPGDVRDLGQLGRLRGVGIKGVERMRLGLVDDEF